MVAAMTGRIGRKAGLAIGTLASIAATPALAHHPLGGELPTTMAHGLLSGVGHPVIGLDHLAFVIGVGIAARMIGRPLVAPIAFVAATIAGTLIHLQAIGLPGVEPAIALSVVAIGLAIMLRASAALMLPLFALAGLFHGHAYGEAVFGAEPTPVLAYLVGFGATQWAIAVAAGLAAERAARAWSEAMPQRLAGAAIAGAGAIVVGEHALAAMGLG